MSGYLVEVPEEMVTKGACRGATGQVSWAEVGHLRKQLGLWEGGWCLLFVSLAGSGLVP